MRVLVTGAKGYIAQNLLRHTIEPKVQLVPFSRNISTLNQEKNDFDIIIHLAAKTRSQNWDILLENNILATSEVVKFANRNNSKIIFLSTCGVYGHKENEKCSEAQPLTENFLTPYAKSKLIAEKEIIQTASNYVILRLFNLYGPMQDISYLIPEIFTKLKNNESIEIKNPRNVLDFIYINDVLEKILFCCNSNISNEIINLGTGIETTLKDLVIKMSQFFPSYTGGINYLTQSNIIKVVSDSKKMNKLLGDVHFSLDSGLSDYLEHGAKIG